MRAVAAGAAAAAADAAGGGQLGQLGSWAVGQLGVGWGGVGWGGSPPLFSFSSFLFSFVVFRFCLAKGGTNMGNNINGSKTEPNWEQHRMGGGEIPEQNNTGGGGNKINKPTQKPLFRFPRRTRVRVDAVAFNRALDALKAGGRGVEAHRLLLAMPKAGVGWGGVGGWGWARFVLQGPEG